MGLLALAFATTTRYSVTNWRRSLLGERARVKPPIDRDNLKILITSTSKTGNTWLKHLLAAIYDLPQVSPELALDRALARDYGPRWIAHQHYYAQPHLLGWAERNNVVLLTTIRHPGDVLLSLYHHVRNYPDNQQYGVEAMLVEPDESRVPERLHAFVEGFFYVVLNISITWISSGASRIVRYEDLWRDPVATLAQLTSEILPVSTDVVERAIELCGIDMLRELSADDQKRFFRKGEIGAWRSQLPAPVIELFRSFDPYPAQFASLGYTLDPDDPLIAAPPRPRPARNPFREQRQFQNGVPVPALAARLYLSFPGDEARRRWPDVSAVGPDSFYAWLNAPCERDPLRTQARPAVSNLTAFLHQMRRGLPGLPADIFGADRAAWALWLLQNAQAQYKLDPAFIQSVQEWADAPAPDDPARDGVLPPITNLLATIYRGRPDVQATYPQLFGRDRVACIVWLLRNGAREHRLADSVTRGISEQFVRWANLPDPNDPLRDGAVPVMTRLAAHVYQHNADLRRQFPNPYGQHRLDYLTWFVKHHSGIAGLVRTVVGSWAVAGRAAPVGAHGQTS